MRVSYRPYRAVHSGLNAFPGFHPGLFSLLPTGGIAGCLGPASGTQDCTISPGDAAFSLHQVGQGIVDAGQAAFAFGAQPIERLRIKTYAHRPPFSRREKMKIAPSGVRRGGGSGKDRTPPAFNAKSCLEQRRESTFRI